MSGRWQKGQSGNLAGRPAKRRPHISAFDIIFDKSLTVTHNGVERALTVDEALQMQTYQAALKGKAMAIRQVLKMIERREVALGPPDRPAEEMKLEIEHDSDNANEAMLLLGILEYGPPLGGGGPGTRRRMLATWAAQAAISRPGRRRLIDKEIEDLKRDVIDFEKLKWPRRRTQ
jgi:Family of unknown function (DUF5681)